MFIHEMGYPNPTSHVPPQLILQYFDQKSIALKYAFPICIDILSFKPSHGKRSKEYQSSFTLRKYSINFTIVINNVSQCHLWCLPYLSMTLVWVEKCQKNSFFSNFHEYCYITWFWCGGFKNQVHFPISFHLPLNICLDISKLFWKCVNGSWKWKWVLKNISADFSFFFFFFN